MGLTLGVVIFFIALSGVGITFRHELMPIVYQDLFKITPEKTQLAPEIILQKTYDYLGPNRPMTNFYASEHEDEAVLIIYKDGGLLPSMITVNPYSGAVVGEMEMIKNAFAVMLFFHTNFFLGKIGSYLMGLFGGILALFVISGIYIWIPQKNIKQKWARTFKLASAGLTQKIHHAAGILFAIPLLISAISGSLIIFDVAYMIMNPIQNQPARVEEVELKGPCSFEQQMKSFKYMTPEMQKHLISVHLCTAKNSVVKFSYGLHNKNFLDGYGRTIIDPVEDKILQVFNSETDPSSWNSKRLTVYPIHTGEYLGTFGRVIVLISGLALMALYITGTSLYLKRRKLKKTN